MIYVITEDEKSGRTFWKTIFCLSEQEYVFVNSETFGNASLVKRCDRVITLAKSGDVLFVAFDNVNSSDFKVQAFLDYCKQRCYEKRITFVYTTYFCFEELFLTYEYFNYVNIPSPYLKCIQLLQRDSNWYDSDITKNISEYNTLKTKEKFCNLLLSKSTRCIPGYFKIVKSSESFNNEGRCWFNTCAVLRKCDDNIKHICLKCNYERFINDLCLDKLNAFIQKSQITKLLAVVKPQILTENRANDVSLKSNKDFKMISSFN